MGRTRTPANLPTRRRRAPAADSEAALARLWAAQAFAPDGLTSADGGAVRVAYAGRPGGRAGPDFRDAVVSIDNAPARVGDVELHREARDFARHGHATDPAYGAVLLHVVFRPNDAPATPLPSGREAPVVAVPPPAGGWPAPLREPCAAAVLRFGADRVGAVLRDAGLWRLRAKHDAALAAIERDGAGQSLYAALAVALGQTANARGMAQLAERLPLTALIEEAREGDEASRAATLRARLLRAAGLDGALLVTGPALPWVLTGLRPAAHPVRRIAALARLIARLSRPDLVSGGRSLVGDLLTGRAATLLRALTVTGGSGPALCGRGRVVEVAVNALLPWAAACATLAGDEDTAARILGLAAGLPAGEPYGAVAHLRRNLRDRRGRSLIGSALAQQGALAMLGEWCRRGGCGHCPLS